MTNAVLYLEPTRFLYSGGNAPSILTCMFPPSSVRDLEVINKLELEKAVEAFITTNKLEPAQVVFILSAGVCFEKDIPAKEKLQQESITTTFLDNIPFERFSWNTFVLQSGVKIVATNLELYQIIQKIFEAHGFSIAIISPSFALSVFGGNPLSPFDQNLASFILKNFDSFKQYSLNPQAIKEDQEETAALNEEPKKKNKSLVVLLPVMGILLLVLGFFVYRMLTEEEPKKAPATAVVAPTSAPAVVTQAAGINRDLRIQIAGSAVQASQINSIKTQLTAAGFTRLETDTTKQSTNPRTLLMYSAAVSPATRQAILPVVQTFFPDVLAQENTASVFDIVIILGGASSSPNPATPTNTP